MKHANNLSNAPIIFDLFGVLLQKEYSTDGRSAIVPLDHGVQLLKELAGQTDDSGQRRPCYLLSNANNATITELAKQYPTIFALFDGIVTSQDAGHSKPDARMYRYLIDKYNLVNLPGIFIDDTLENVIAAEQCGLIGIQWTNAGAVRSILKGLNVLQ